MKTTHAARADYRLLLLLYNDNNVTSLVPSSTKKLQNEDYLYYSANIDYYCFFQYSNWNRLNIDQGPRPMETYEHMSDLRCPQCIESVIRNGTNALTVLQLKSSKML